jgi:hypothetical protein
MFNLLASHIRKYFRLATEFISEINHLSISQWDVEQKEVHHKVINNRQRR